MKILNLYAGIGGNRKLWGDEHEITAVENDPPADEVKLDEALKPLSDNGWHDNNGARIDCRKCKSIAKAKKSIQSILAEAERRGRIDENQRRLDKIIEWKNRKPIAGELTSANFGSAGAGMEISSLKHSLEDRIALLQKEQS